jgi:hypothetical protein
MVWFLAFQFDNIVKLQQSAIARVLLNEVTHECVMLSLGSRERATGVDSGSGKYLAKNHPSSVAASTI